MKPNYCVKICTDFGEICIPAHILIYSRYEDETSPTEEVRKVFSGSDVPECLIFAEELEETQGEKTND